MLGMTLNPLPVHKSIGDPHIKRIETHCDLLPLNLRIAKELAPVVHMMNLYTVAGHNFRRSLNGRGHGDNQELIIVRNHAMLPLASFCQPRKESLSRILSECGVAH
jgi:hypothetical protein